MKTIYLLQLENARYFIYSRETDRKLSIVYLFLEATLKYDYLKTYKPLMVLNQWPEVHTIDVDTQVKKHMILYGIENVRGGTYSAAELTPQQKQLLDDELNHSAKGPPESVIKEVIETYAATPISRETVKKEKAKLVQEYTKWQKESQILRDIWIDVSSARENIEWIRSACLKQIESFEEGKRQTLLYRIDNKVDIAKYRQTLYVFRRIYNIFMKTYNKLYTNSADLPLKNPEFLLDDFFLHWSRIHLPDQAKKVERLCNEYLFFVTFIENRIAEAEFDIYSWAQDAQWRFPCGIFLLDMCETQSTY